MTVAETLEMSAGLARDDCGEAGILAEPTDNPSWHMSAEDLWRVETYSRVVDGPDVLDGARGPDEDPAWFDTDEFRALEERVLWRSCVEDSVGRARGEVAELAMMGTSMVMERLTEAEAIDLARQLEELSCSLAAAQARVAVVVDAQTRAQQADCGVPAAKRGVGVAAQLGLARRDSHARARNRLALAKDLINELPETMRALTAGVTTEYRASLVARATAVLDPDTRRGVDAIIGPELKDLSDRAVDSRARALAYQADPHAFAAASERSAEERYVGIRPAPTTMARVTGFLPAPEGVACYAALDSAARTAQAAGDERTLAQLRADIFAERITGRHPRTDGPDIEVGIINTDHTLLGDHPPAGPNQTSQPGPAEANEAPASGDAAEQTESGACAAPGESVESVGVDAGRDGRSQPEGARPESAFWPPEREEPLGDPDPARGDPASVGPDLEVAAYLVGFGPVPAAWARAVIRGRDRDPDSVSEQKVFWRRLFTAPDGSVQNIDTTRRVFPAALRAAIVARDRYCRTPWCGAPIRQIDHVIRAADGGHETWDNAQGLCQACNLAKEAPGWRADPTTTGPPGRRAHLVTTTTPTGHTYESRPPPVG